MMEASSKKVGNCKQEISSVSPFGLLTIMKINMKESTTESGNWHEAKEKCSTRRYELVTFPLRLNVIYWK